MCPLFVYLEVVHFYLHIPRQSLNVSKMFHRTDTLVTLVTPVTLITPITPVTPITPITPVTPVTPVTPGRYAE